MIDTYDIVLKFPFKAISKDNEKVFNRQGRPFTSAKYKHFERTIKQLACMQYKGKSLDGDLEMVIEAYFNTGTRCDCFNIPKGIADALQGICYHNDKQIVCGKIFISKAQENSFTVFIKRLQTSPKGEQEGV